MKPCFVASTPLFSSAAGRNSSPPVCKTSIKNTLRMAAAEGEEKKEMSFGDWLFKKIMHNQDDVYGYEPYHKEAMNARDDEKKRVYSANDKNKAN